MMGLFPEYCLMEKKKNTGQLPIVLKQQLLRDKPKGKYNKQYTGETLKNNVAIMPDGTKQACEGHYTFRYELSTAET